MQNEIVEINSKEVVVKEFRGQRVVTFKDIDRVHERPDGTARRNFNINKNHFILGEDYFCLLYTSTDRLVALEEFVFILRKCHKRIDVLQDTHFRSHAVQDKFTGFHSILKLCLRIGGVNLKLPVIDRVGTGCINPCLLYTSSVILPPQLSRTAS